MSDAVLGFLAGFIPAAAAAALGWIKWLHEVREKRREREGRSKAEAELMLIRRRGSAPFICPDMTAFNHFVLPQEKAGELPIVMAGSPELLCFDREEVDPEKTKGRAVIFIIKNVGEAADKIRLTIAGEKTRLVEEPDFHSAHGLVAMVYDYVPDKHGEEQIIEVWFQSRSGFEDTHRYRTRHGFRLLNRIDPP